MTMRWLVSIWLVRGCGFSRLAGTGMELAVVLVAFGIVLAIVCHFVVSLAVALVCCCSLLASSLSFGCGDVVFPVCRLTIVGKGKIEL